MMKKLTLFFLLLTTQAMSQKKINDSWSDWTNF
ncbi:MAG: hypothetical protein RL282_1501, partial [Bacteroidota bacterium]